MRTGEMLGVGVWCNGACLGGDSRALAYAASVEISLDAAPPSRYDGASRSARHRTYVSAVLPLSAPSANISMERGDFGGRCEQLAMGAQTAARKGRINSAALGLDSRQQVNAR
ncbi:hypothetical protein HYPSUDRAFT_221407 [Hypholoma sublateritium FD-334 SS-4]|uniref:Uncharacterized protein n=1 Tax=Hypholoma sublateritium (strain FD-334 SS-4) TaxID=945553 RepID=A0A0D2MZH0_HYPSF|nr:hypothetical protein HYPSUDRAFT_221407 [Hypholoma sublateritium FD-334 SS-4]